MLNTESSHLVPIAKINKDIIKSAIKLGDSELRWLVDYYYQMH